MCLKNWNNFFMLYIKILTEFINFLVQYEMRAFLSLFCLSVCEPTQHYITDSILLPYLPMLGFQTSRTASCTQCYTYHTCYISRPFHARLYNYFNTFHKLYKLQRPALRYELQQLRCQVSWRPARILRFIFKHLAPFLSSKGLVFTTIQRNG
jgi:hypothetical protein